MTSLPPIPRCRRSKPVGSTCAWCASYDPPGNVLVVVSEVSDLLRTLLQVENHPSHGRVDRIVASESSRTGCLVGDRRVPALPDLLRFDDGFPASRTASVDAGTVPRLEPFPEIQQHQRLLVTGLELRA